MNEPYLLRTITQQYKKRKGRHTQQGEGGKQKEKEERRKEGNHNQGKKKGKHVK